MTSESTYCSEQPEQCWREAEKAPESVEEKVTDLPLLSVSAANQMTWCLRSSNERTWREWSTEMMTSLPRRHELRRRLPRTRSNRPSCPSSSRAEEKHSLTCRHVMIPNDLSDSMMFPVAPPSGQAAHAQLHCCSDCQSREMWLYRNLQPAGGAGGASLV